MSSGNAAVKPTKRLDVFGQDACPLVNPGEKAELRVTEAQANAKNIVHGAHL
jgi:hypothetical protein